MQQCGWLPKAAPQRAARGARHAGAARATAAASGGYGVVLTLRRSLAGWCLTQRSTYRQSTTTKTRCVKTRRCSAAAAATRVPTARRPGPFAPSQTGPGPWGQSMSFCGKSTRYCHRAARGQRLSVQHARKQRAPGDAAASFVCCSPCSARTFTRAAKLQRTGRCARCSRGTKP